jgi:hypothetical protein
VSTNSNNPIEPSQQVDSIAAKDDQPEKDFDDSGSQHSNADVQIQAHRKRHRQQQTKLFGGAGVLAIITLLMVVAYFLFTSESAKQGETTVAQPEVPMSALEITQFREAFKQALTQYEINVQPNIDEIMMSDWQPQKASELALIKNQALTAFAQGAFAQAKQTIETLLQRSTALIVKWQKQIEQYINDGQEAFDNDQIPQAQLLVNKALALSSTNIKAMELQNRIYAFGEASKLVEELKIALFENNWPKQVEVITDIIEIDPQRTELADELANAKAQYTKQQLAKYLSRADTALQQNQLVQAQRSVNQAKAIKPNSKGAQALSDRINQAKAEEGLREIKTAIKDAANADNWAQVNTLVLSSLAQHSNDVELKNYQGQAQQILSAKKSLAVFVARPHRLADDNIRQAAVEAVQSAFGASILSPSLQQQIEQVTSAIDQYNNPVEVQVNSDGKTYIVVLGVGHVGEYKQKVISLKPGKYVLQGKREGYRNKRVEFTVKANTPISVSLVCDERI